MWIAFAHQARRHFLVELYFGPLFISLGVLYALFGSLFS